MLAGQPARRIRSQKDDCVSDIIGLASAAKRRLTDRQLLIIFEYCHLEIVRALLRIFACTNQQAAQKN